MKFLGNTGITKLLELINTKFLSKSDSISNNDISTAWGSTDPVNSYIENSVYSMTDSEIAAAWNDVNVDSTTGDGIVNGDLYVNGDISTTDGDLNVDGDVYADHVYNAVYNDYAEYFPKGEETEPGDVIVLDLDSDKERYIKSRANNKIVVGVYSDEYAFLIGGNKTSEAENKKYFIPVSLAGRVKVKFTGLAKKGTYVVASEINGVARAYIKNEDEPEQIFGILVEEDNKEDEIRRLKIKLK